MITRHIINNIVEKYGKEVKLDISTSSGHRFINAKLLEPELTVESYPLYGTIEIEQKFNPCLNLIETIRTVIALNQISSISIFEGNSYVTDKQ